MAVIADGLDALSKEEILSSDTRSSTSNKKDGAAILKLLQETSEGVAHLSVQWPNYANNYDNNVLEVFKLIQVRMTRNMESKQFVAKIYKKNNFKLN
jgi:hypothetical protein